MIQRYYIEQISYSSFIQQEYDKITKKEEVTKIAQLTINNLSDFTRKTIICICVGYTGSKNAIKFMSTLKVALNKVSCLDFNIRLETVD
jgi:hypothetical protein